MEHQIGLIYSHEYSLFLCHFKAAAGNIPTEKQCKWNVAATITIHTCQKWQQTNYGVRSPSALNQLTAAWNMVFSATKRKCDYIHRGPFSICITNALNTKSICPFWTNGKSWAPIFSFVDYTWHIRSHQPFRTSQFVCSPQFEEEFVTAKRNWKCFGVTESELNLNFVLVFCRG